MTSRADPSAVWMAMAARALSACALLVAACTGTTAPRPAVAPSAEPAPQQDATTAAPEPSVEPTPVTPAEDERSPLFPAPLPALRMSDVCPAERPALDAVLKAYPKDIEDRGRGSATVEDLSAVAPVRDAKFGDRSGIAGYWGPTDLDGDGAEDLILEYTSVDFWSRLFFLRREGCFAYAGFAEGYQVELSRGPSGAGVRVLTYPIGPASRIEQLQWNGRELRRAKKLSEPRSAFLERLPLTLPGGYQVTHGKESHDRATPWALETAGVVGLSTSTVANATATPSVSVGRLPVTLMSPAHRTGDWTFVRSDAARIHQIVPVRERTSPDRGVAVLAASRPPDELVIDVFSATWVLALLDGGGRLRGRVALRTRIPHSAPGLWDAIATSLTTVDGKLKVEIEYSHTGGGDACEQRFTFLVRADSGGRLRLEQSTHTEEACGALGTSRR
jgi:hypothetical protein